MSTSDGHAISNQPSFADRPWVPVLIPLAVVIGVGLVVVGLTILRRRVLFRRGGALRLSPQGRQALERDLEERITRGYRRPAATAAAAPGDAWSHPGGGYYGRRARTANRWAWLAASRREEGLNELGEAPPPYAGRSGSAARKDEAVAAVEMTGYVRGGGGREEDASRASASAEPAPAPPPPSELPPAYNLAVGRTGPGDQGRVAVPAPAVLPPEGRVGYLYG